jgi:hypothetical protein
MMAMQPMGAFVTSRVVSQEKLVCPELLNARGVPAHTATGTATATRHNPTHNTVFTACCMIVDYTMQ